MRCFGDNDIVLAKYHDQEWGRVTTNDKDLFEMLVLEGAQAGLNWLTILKRRQNYKTLLHNYNTKRVLVMSNFELDSLLKNKKIIRTKLKIYSIRKIRLYLFKYKKNLKLFLTIHEDA